MSDNDSSWETDIEEDFEIVSGYAEDQLAHDDAGNLTYDGLHQYTYDAWNRLTKVERAYPGDTGPEVTSVVATLSYDGLGRRVTKKVENSADWVCTYHFYYAGQRVVESHDGSDNVLKQYVWDARYIDAPVLRWRDGNTDDDLDDEGDDTLYYMTDANFNVTALIDDAGNLVERYLYHPYGRVYVRHPDWTTDADGLSDYDNEILYAGYRYDPETAMYQVRNRYYHPSLGRWLSRDALEYFDAMNLYEYVMGRPCRFVDPMGLGLGWIKYVPQALWEALKAITPVSWCTAPVECAPEVTRMGATKKAVLRMNILIAQGKEWEKDPEYRHWNKLSGCGD